MYCRIQHTQSEKSWLTLQPFLDGAINKVGQEVGDTFVPNVIWIIKLTHFHVVGTDKIFFHTETFEACRGLWNLLRSVIDPLQREDNVQSNYSQYATAIKRITTYYTYPCDRYGLINTRNTEILANCRERASLGLEYV